MGTQDMMAPPVLRDNKALKDHRQDHKAPKVLKALKVLKAPRARPVLKAIKDHKVD